MHVCNSYTHAGTKKDEAYPAVRDVGECQLGVGPRHVPVADLDKPQPERRLPGAVPLTVDGDLHHHAHAQLGGDVRVEPGSHLHQPHQGRHVLQQRLRGL